MIVTINAFAQTASLRRGYYKTQGTEDEIFIMPNSIYDVQANGFRQRYGFYGISVWSGHVINNNFIFIATGVVSGNEIHFIVDETNIENYDKTDEINTVIAGSNIIYTITAHESFRDNYGQRWVWNRDSRGF